MLARFLPCHPARPSPLLEVDSLCCVGTRRDRILTRRRPWKSFAPEEAAADTGPSWSSSKPMSADR
jgi:hypothetical protein